MADDKPRRETVTFYVNKVAHTDLPTGAPYVPVPGGGFTVYGVLDLAKLRLEGTVIVRCVIVLPDGERQAPPDYRLTISGKKKQAWEVEVSSYLASRLSSDHNSLLSAHLLDEDGVPLANPHGGIPIRLDDTAP